MTTHSPLPSFALSAGSHTASIALVGEAFGANEAEHEHPFVGYSGRELGAMLIDAGAPVTPFPRRFMDPRAMISWWAEQNVFLTNVIPAQPPDNKIEAFCGNRETIGKDYRLPPISMGHYLRPEFLPELDRLREELETVRPNIIVALGNIACWALLRTTSISRIRGTVAPSVLVKGAKVLPTFHPAYVLRQWASRPIVVADLIKATRESAFHDIRRPERQILINPTLPQIREWFTRPAQMYACDIETAHKGITAVGFARSVSDAIVIPFLGPHGGGGSHWQTVHEEVEAWRAIKGALEGPVPKVFQNGLYDLSYLCRMGIRPQNCIEDTMLLHHSIYPELNKGLGFLGSLYASEPAWKLMNRKRPEDKDTKSDE